MKPRELSSHKHFMVLWVNVKWSHGDQMDQRRAKEDDLRQVIKSGWLIVLCPRMLSPKEELVCVWILEILRGFTKLRRPMTHALSGLPYSNFTYSQVGIHPFSRHKINNTSNITQRKYQLFVCWCHTLKRFCNPHFGVEVQFFVSNQWVPWAITLGLGRGQETVLPLLRVKEK